MLENLNISNTGFLFDTLSGSTYTVNETGRFILENLQNGKNIKEIIELVKEEFDSVDNSYVDLDISDFIFQLKSFGLMKKVNK